LHPPLLQRASSTKNRPPKTYWLLPLAFPAPLQVRRPLPKLNTQQARLAAHSPALRSATERSAAHTVRRFHAVPPATTEHTPVCTVDSSAPGDRRTTHRWPSPLRPEREQNTLTQALLASAGPIT